MNDYWNREDHRRWWASLNHAARFGGLPHAALRHFHFHHETSIEAVADILVGAAKTEGSAIGTFKGIQLRASVESTAEAIVADYNRRVTFPISQRHMAALAVEISLKCARLRFAAQLTPRLRELHAVAAPPS